MPNFEVDKWPIRDLIDYFRRGRLELRPPYQRGRAWSDEMRLSLIDTVLNDYPMGVILLDESEEPDAEGVGVIKWATVDGQQRCTTIFEYLEGNASWTQEAPPAESSFTRFDLLSQARQNRVLDYVVPVARLRTYGEDQIRDIFIRIQYGKALQIGEKIKAFNSPYHPFIEGLASHRLFADWGAPHQYRDAHWALVAAYFKAGYRQRPLERQEYRQLERFLREQSAFVQQRARKAGDELTWILNYAHRVLFEAINQDLGFKRDIRNQRLFKWLIPALMMLRSTFALAGKEPEVASGLREYWVAKEAQGTDEYEAYFRTLRTGRIDTDEVKACLEQMMNWIIAVAQLRPLDPTRFFTVAQRRQILQASGSHCEAIINGQRCNAVLASTNFHADHRTPHALGGRTEVSNGQALCSSCNRSKGARSALAEVFSP